MEQTQSKCTGNCMACSIYQRQFCASQLSFNNMKMMGEMSQVLASMKESIVSLNKSIETMQNNEANVFDPTNNALKNEEVDEKAQSGDGAAE